MLDKSDLDNKHVGSLVRKCGSVSGVVSVKLEEQRVYNMLLKTVSILKKQF